MRRRILVIGLVLVTLLVAGTYYDASRKAKESLLSGFFDSLPTEVSSRQAGRVAKVLVKEGDTVQANQPLVILETGTSEALVKAQEAAAEGARQEFLAAARGPRKEEIARQAGAVQEAEANLLRLRNGALPEEVDAARSRLRSAQDQYEKMSRGSRPEEIRAAEGAAGVALQKLRQSQRGPTPEERAQAKARFDQAKAAAVLAHQNLARTQYLFDEGAVSRQRLDTDRSARDQAVAAEREASEAYRRSELGTPKEELAQAEQGYREAKAQLDLVRNGNRIEDVRAAKENLSQAEANLRLVLRGSRQEDIAAGKARLEQARAAFDELKRGNRPEDVARAKATADQAAQQARADRETLAERTVRAPFAGTIEKVLVAAGTLLTAGQQVAQMHDPSDIWVRIYLPESDLAKVNVGDAAALAIDGIDGTVKGRVESIASRGEFTPANLQTPEERGRQVFAVRIRLAAPDQRVKVGMVATVKSVGRWP